MKLTNEERQGLVAGIIANCDCWKAQGDDRVLNGFSDEKLVTLKEHIDKEKQAIVVANAAVNGFSDGQTAYRVNPETGKWERRVLANAKKKPAYDAEDDGPGGDDGADEDEEDAVAENAKRVAGKGATRNERRPRTADEWYRNAPPEVQETHRYAEQVVNREKNEIIQKLLVNVAEGDRQAHRERLQRRSLEDLHGDLSLVPKMPTQDEVDRAAGATTNKRRARQQPDEDMLGLPTINWESVDGKDEKKKPAQVSNAQIEDDEVSVDEWLKTAPPNVRQAVHNATAVEARERRKVIDELVANFQGTDEQEQRLVARLNNKSLEELRDLQSLSPRRDGGRANYFGAAAAPTGNTRATDVNEDVLPLPTMDWAAAAKAN